jgi:hypothetical protein
MCFVRRCASAADELRRTMRNKRTMTGVVARCWMMRRKRKAEKIATRGPRRSEARDVEIDRVARPHHVSS